MNLLNSKGKLDNEKPSWEQNRADKKKSKTTQDTTYANS